MTKWYTVHIGATTTKGFVYSDESGCRCYGKAGVKRYVDHAIGWNEAHNRIPHTPQIIDEQTGADVSRKFGY